MRYYYEGPVFEFEKCICDKWSSQTVAPTEQKARSNLSYQFKKKFGRVPNAKIRLTGKIYTVG